MTDATSWHWQIFAEFTEKHQHVCGTTSFHSFEGCVFHLSPSMSLPVQFSTTHRCHCHHYNATAGAQPGVFESPAHESAAHLWGIELRWNRCGTRTTGWNHWNDVSCFWRYDLPMTIPGAAETHGRAQAGGLRMALASSVPMTWI